MSRKEEIQREKNFRKLCSFMEEAADIAMMLCQEIPVYKRKVMLKFNTEGMNPEDQWIAHAYQTLSMMSALTRLVVMKLNELNDEDHSGFGI